MNKNKSFEPWRQDPQVAKSEEELENLLLRAEDLSGWCHWDSNLDPRKQVFKDFLRLAIQPLLEEIKSLRADLDERTDPDHGKCLDDGRKP